MLVTVINLTSSGVRARPLGHLLLVIGKRLQVCTDRVSHNLGIQGDIFRVGSTVKLAHVGPYLRPLEKGHRLEQRLPHPPVSGVDLRLGCECPVIRLPQTLNVHLLPRNHPRMRLVVLRELAIAKLRGNRQRLAQMKP